ncbi:MAG: hypothetical protein GKS06_14480 [Acidobacteria bacterium]|nr:hypothetical protein [Acidobacteriota bacterium]
MFPSRSSRLLALATGVAIVTSGIAAGDDPATVTFRSFPIDAGATLRQIAFPPAGVPVPTTAEAFVVTTLINFSPVSPVLAGLKPVKGKVRVDGTCFGTPNVTTSGQLKLDRGFGIDTQVLDQTNGCNFFQTQPMGRGGSRNPWDSNGQVIVSVQPFDPSSGCQPSETALCLGPNSRFQVEVDWEDFEKTRSAMALPTAPDSGTFWFFNPENVSMVVRVLDKTNVSGFNNFWVFAAGLTDVEATLTVTDTQTSLIKVYTSVDGHFPSVGDTDAF